MRSFLCRPLARLAVTLAFVVGCGFQSPPEELNADLDGWADADSLAEAYHAETEAPGLVVGAATPDTQHVHGAGTVGPEREAVPTERTVYQIGSVTKVFTGLALANMAAEGTVALDQPVSGRLPDSLSTLTAGEAPVTLEHLATHTSGLARLPDNLDPEDQTNPYAGYGEEELMAFVESAELEAGPGEAYEYSNAGAGLLGHLLERADDRPYGEVVRERIAEPLGLEDLYREPSEAPDERLARGIGGFFNEPLPPWEFDALAGAGALFGSVADLLRLGEAAAAPGETALGEALRKAQEPRFEPEDGPAVGLGWHVLEVEGREVLWHNGQTGSFGSALAVDPERGHVAVALVSSSTDPTPLVLEILEELPLGRDGA